MLQTMGGSFHLTSNRQPILNRRQEVYIYGFHDVVNLSDPQQVPPNRRIFDIDWSTDEMKKLLEYLAENNYWTLTSSEFFDYFYTQSKPIPLSMRDKKPIMLTFDDGYKGVHENLLPLLEDIEARYHVQLKAVLFVNPALMKVQDGDLKYMSCEDLNDGYSKGYFDVQSHNLTHRNLPELPLKELVFELSTSKKLLNSCLGERHVQFIAYPYGKKNPQVMNYAKNYYRAGFVYDGKVFRVKDRKNNRMNISRLTVNRFQNAEQIINILNNSQV